MPLCTLQSGYRLMRFLWLLPILGVVSLDQITKYLIAANMRLHETIPVFEGILNLTYIHNKGAAMGMLHNNRWVFMIISTVTIIGISIIMFSQYKKYYNPLLYTALSFIVGGGIGNMIDRVYLGYVVDFVDVKFIPFWKWIFNVADIFVCVGCGLVVLYIILDDIKSSKSKKADGESAINS